MDRLKWRPWAKAVAIIDIVFISIGFVTILGVSLLLGVGTIQLLEENNLKLSSNSSYDKPYNGNDAGKAISQVAISWFVIWLVLVLLLVFGTLILQMWAAVKLLNSTDRGNTPHDSYGKARFWRNVTVVLFVFSIFACIARLFKVAPLASPVLFLFILVTSVVSVSVRGLAIYVVSKFMKELDILRSPKGDEMCKVPMKV